MSQQGGTPTGRDDDWWGQLYDDSTGDTGPTAAPDSLDDRFASAAGTVGRRPDHDTRVTTKPPSPATDPAQAAGASPLACGRSRAGGGSLALACGRSRAGGGSLALARGRSRPGGG
ncbi:hypothetical protein LV779_10990 [Streptomyces thinghirensis]|nr:hypothetical protein [Streptomyces thinghirensis]